MAVREGPGRVAHRLQRARAAASPKRGAALGPEAGRLPATPPLVARGGPGLSV